MQTPKIQYPKRGQMWADELTLLAGNALLSLVQTNQKFNMYSYHGTAYGNGDSAGWNFQCEAGDYTFNVLYIKSQISGIVDYYIDGVAISTGHDHYNASVTYSHVLTISVTGLTSGRHTFKYVVNGKNASSTNYAAYFTKVFFKQSTD